MLPFTTCVVAGLQYLIHPQKLGSIQETINSDAIIPITLLTTDEVFGDLEGILQLFDSYDDVFNLDFGSVLVEKPGSGESHVVIDTTLAGRHVYHLDQITALEDMAELPSGPYFLHGPNLHQAWRMYDDEFGAFTIGVIPDSLYQPAEFQPLTSSSLQGDSQAIPVPSRLYHARPSPRKPLSGVRISVSDTVSLKGTHTTFSSRAWKSLYRNPSDVTAEYAQKLLDLGAVLVGKTKTLQFGTGTEWVDEQAPWSARGDGYGRMKGGSVGAAAASIGYEWLQHSIGVDNGWVVPDSGIYSIATSQGVSIDDVWTTSSLDKTRLLSRSLEDLLDITAKTLDQHPQEPKFPKRVLYPVDMIPVDERQQEALDDFVMTLENLLGVEAQRIDIGAIWAENPPSEASDEDMQTYMKHAPFRSWCYEYYHAFNEFRHEYRQKTQKEAFAESTPRFFWDKCKTITETEYRKDLGRLEIYRQWFDEYIMATTPNADAILVLPCRQSSRVEHRDEAVAPPTISEGVGPEMLAFILGVPHLAVPFTQVPYESRISGRTEYQTVCVSVIGPRGSDTGIIQIVKQALEKAHVPTRVETGRLAFPADTLRNSSYPKTVPQPTSLSDEL